MIHTYIAYAPKEHQGNLGWAYNNFMSYLKDDDWACFLDHDACFLTPTWYTLLNRAIENNPEYGLFTCYTNRIGQKKQILPKIRQDKAEENHNIAYHRTIAKELEKKKGHKCSEMKEILSGVLILISKQTWEKSGGFSNGFYGVDGDIHKSCIKAGIKVGLMEGLYVYHWYRGDGCKFPGIKAKHWNMKE